MDKKTLSIIIPTFNRAKFLDTNLENLSQLSQYDFDLIICDNASQDNTNEIALKWKEKIPNLKYYHQEKNVGYDRNVATGYSLVETDYCWILGDSYSIPEETLLQVLEILQNEHPDAVMINAFNQLNISSKIYTDVNILMRDCGWYLTLLSSCIISKDFLQPHLINRYIGTNFVHLGIFFDYLASQKKIEVYWLNNANLNIINEGFSKAAKNTNSWIFTPFSVFGRAWFAFVMSLSNQISIDSKIKCIAAHDAHTHIFSFRVLLNRKASGQIDFKDFKEARKFMPFVTKTPLFFLDLLYIMPKLPQVLIQLIRKIKRDAR